MMKISTLMIVISNLNIMIHKLILMGTHNLIIKTNTNTQVAPLPWNKSLASPESIFLKSKLILTM